MKQLKKIFLRHLSLRIINLLSCAFVLYLVMLLSKGQEQFVLFLKNWKLCSIGAVLIFIVHLAVELKTAIEDYVPHPDRRIAVIKIVWGIAIITIALIGVTIGQL